MTAHSTLHSSFLRRVALSRINIAPGRPPRTCLQDYNKQMDIKRKKFDDWLAKQPYDDETA